MRRWRGARTRWWTGSAWDVRARIERFVEPALLLLLRERPTHGYELLEQLPELLGEQRVDVGNVYRALRALEEDGLVESEWSAELPGPAKRTYTLTAEGNALLAAWIESLGVLRDELTAFLDRARGGDHVRETSPPPRELAGSES
jgi:poly-beta-hydroxybutyrate-responsive repressor